MKTESKNGETRQGLARRTANRERGAALPIALLLMTIVMGLGIAMVVAVSSDLFVNMFYRNNRASYYGADAGLNIVRRDIENRIMAAAPANFPAGTPPIPPGTEAVVRAAVLGQYGNYQSITPPSQGGTGSVNSQPSRFRLENLQLSLILNPPQPEVTARDAANNPSAYRYTYAYDVRTVGQSSGAEELRLEERGLLILNASITPAANKTVKFSNWGFFVDQQTVCSGSSLVPGTVTGPVHTNGGWTFGTSGQYIFTDPVSQSNNNMGFQFNNTCLQSSTAPVSRGGTTINPNFQAGMSTAAPNVPLPSNDFSQKRAVLDGQGTNATNPSGAEMQELRTITGASHSGNPSSGVFVPYDPATNTVTGAGIHVAGNASVVVSTVGASGQRFQITQGSTITTITVDPIANTTVIQSGATTRTLVGHFKDLSTLAGPTPADAFVNPAYGTPGKSQTMLYVEGSITSLRGPAQSVAAVQDGASVTVTAAANVTITGDLLYKTPPVTKVANDPRCPGCPSGSLIPGNDNQQVLGVFTRTGDIQLNNGNSNGVLEVDASLATIGQGSTGGVVNVGSRINTLNIVGGRIQSTIKNINTTTRNVYYDRRFATGFGPSWFPSTTISPPGVAAATYTSSAQRTRWFNSTQK